MPLAPEEHDLLRACMKRVLAETPAFAEAFHETLFALAPETRALYRSDLSLQGQMLANRLGVIVAQMHLAEPLRPFVRDLAERHAGYGARPEHFPVVGEALIAAFRRVMGAAFDPATEAAWRKAYGELSAAMLADG